MVTVRLASRTFDSACGAYPLMSTVFAGRTDDEKCQPHAVSDVQAPQHHWDRDGKAKNNTPTSSCLLLLLVVDA